MRVALAATSLARSWCPSDWASDFSETAELEGLYLLFSERLVSPALGPGAWMLSCKVRLAAWRLGSRIIHSFAVTLYFPSAPGRGRPLVGVSSPPDAGRQSAGHFWPHGDSNRRLRRPCFTDVSGFSEP